MPSTAEDDRLGEYRLIPLDSLQLGEENIRRRDITANLDELAKSMHDLGLQQPIVVQRSGDKYEIVIGQRRYLAAKQLGWKRIAARVVQDRLNDLDAKVISFAENVQRRDLSPRDKSDTCAYLLQRLRTASAVADKLGLTEQTVRKWLGYAAVPEGLKKLVEAKRLTVPLALRLSQTVLDERKAVAIAEAIATAPKSQRDRIMDAAEEMPDGSLSAIVARAEQMRRQVKITFVLPDKWSSVMSSASDRLGISPSEIALDATVEWLQMMRY